MPIGKSSISRVANNGYSNVVSEAPDMENSEDVNVAHEASVKKLIDKVEPKKKSPPPVEKSPEIKEEKLPEVKQEAAEKTNDTPHPSSKKPAARAKKAPAKKDEKPKTQKESTADKANETDNVSYVNVGKSMPSYLL